MNSRYQIKFPSQLQYLLLILALLSIHTIDLQARQEVERIKILYPTSQLLKSIESAGGRVARYKIGEFADVYLNSDLKQHLIERKFAYQSLPREDALADTLSNDLVIGNSYHNYQAVTQILDSLAGLYSNICHLQSIGQTELGREIWAICLSDNPSQQEIEPEVKLIANIHGNELITQEVILCFIDSLLANYDSNVGIKSFLDSTALWIVPNMNFDGAQNISRLNANGVDLNRDFPDREFDSFPESNGRAAETKSVMSWSNEHQFVLAASFHAGELVVNYPWDKNLTGETGYASTPDDGVFKRISLAYATENDSIYNNPQFENGISNGALWYEISGSMQDWSYNWLNTFDVTIEMSEAYMPPKEEIRDFFSQNRTAIFNYIKQVRSGLHGIVTDSVSGQPVSVALEVEGISKVFRNDSTQGDFYRLLEPGNYRIVFTNDDYYPFVAQDVLITPNYITYLYPKMVHIPRYVYSGTVYDSQTSLPLEHVCLTFRTANQIVDSVSTDSEGRFEVYLREGHYNAAIEREEYFELSDSIALNSDISTEYYLEKIIPAHISGIIVSEDQQSVSGTVVYCQGKTDTVNTSGHFRIDSLVAGGLNIFAHKSNYRTSYLDTLLLNGDSLSLQINLLSGINGFATDFESANEYFSGTGDWQKGSVNSGPWFAYSGTKTWATNLSGNYKEGVHYLYLQSPFLFVQGLVLPALEFYHWYDFEQGYDGGNLKISTNEGVTWQLLEPSPFYPLLNLPAEYNNPMQGQPAYSGSTGTWQKVQVDLNAFRDNPSILIRFEVGTDEQKVANGWYIDNFRLFDANATAQENKAIAQNKSDISLKVFPNPANPVTQIQINGLSGTDVHLKIYNIRGQIIRSARVEKSGRGIVNWKWDGRDHHQINVASGLYLLQVKTKTQSLTKKIMLIR